jgi:GH15 family glucan-1,4-alpha-glucosidase
MRSQPESDTVPWHASGEQLPLSTTPIGDYALLSDRHSAALVSRDGSIDWLCFPRFDSPSIFARLLGDKAGYWAIQVAGEAQVTRRYVDRTMVLETTFRTPGGTVAIIDALAMGDGNRGHELGKDAPHLLLRRATCIEGEVELSLDFGLVPSTGSSIPCSTPSMVDSPLLVAATSWSSPVLCPWPSTSRLPLAS